MLASRLPTILPELTRQEALEVAAIASMSHNGFHPSAWKKIPFRSPHHSSSHVALVGGGRPPKPGEISLAHHGVLFLDEFPEYQRQVLESLREPLESGQINISRAAYQAIFPAQFQLIAAMNPCPCGFAGSEQTECRCRPEHVKRYFNKLSGPLLDRIDMHVEVGHLPLKVFHAQNELREETSEVVRHRVIAARQFQFERQKKWNSLLSVHEIEEFCRLDQASQQLLHQVMQKFNWSARVYHRLIKISRTIADLKQVTAITPEQVSEALNYRCLDRLKW
jgi:magnesium chelatase family protein